MNFFYFGVKGRNFDFPIYNKEFEKAVRKVLKQNKMKAKKKNVKDLPFYYYYTITFFTTSQLAAFWMDVEKEYNSGEKK